MPDDIPTGDDSTHDSGQHVGFFNRIRDHRTRAEQGFQTLKEHLAEESEETKCMLDIYRRALEGNTTRAERRMANEQFKDLLRIAGLGTFFGLVPGSMLLLPLAIMGANKVGIRLLPSSFASVQPPPPDVEEDGP